MLASEREARSDVIRILRRVVVGAVAIDTSGGGACVLASGVAGSAVERRVRAEERESYEIVVVTSAVPGVHGSVAVLANGLEAKSDVVRRLRIGEIIHVAANAVDGKTLKLSGRKIFVAGIALDHCMCA